MILNLVLLVKPVPVVFVEAEFLLRMALVATLMVMLAQ